MKFFEENKFRNMRQFGLRNNFLTIKTFYTVYADHTCGTLICAERSIWNTMSFDVLLLIFFVGT